jgi:16S rRNA (guanine966-N2)-methyltransferase
VREALFSRLEHLDAIEGARVLDLYAGSGALGLEAASRGAAEVVLVESARPAADVCRRNVATLGLPAVRVAVERVLPFLQRTLTWQVDLVLVDPPYELGETELGEVLAALARWLSDDAVVVVERSVRTPEPSWPVAGASTDGVGGAARTGPGLVRRDERRYGETVLWFATPQTTGTPDRAGSGRPAS